MILLRSGIGRNISNKGDHKNKADHGLGFKYGSLRDEIVFDL